jgi:hypothetical protein
MAKHTCVVAAMQEAISRFKELAIRALARESGD